MHAKPYVATLTGRKTLKLLHDSLSSRERPERDTRWDLAVRVLG